MEANLAELSKYQISRFFEKNAPATREECDLEAVRILGTPVHATSLQGGQSYTVLNSDETRVIQFRAGYAALDMEFLEHIEQAYGRFAAHHESIGRLGQLHVYVMPNVGGVSMYLARDALNKNNFSLRKRTVQDFARFFASAWNNTPRQMACPSRDSLLEQYSSELSQLHVGLPERFRPTLANLISTLPSLLQADWPLVPNHTDLLENNIHVSKETGHLVGICDWKDAVISPFGMSLGGLETMLGTHTMSRGWCYHSSQQELRDLFWETLYQEMGGVSEAQKELVNVARLTGLFLANGFDWKDGLKVPASEGFDGLCYLESVTLTLKTTQASLRTLEMEHGKYRLHLSESSRQ
ncbi:hypothetical protein CYLTODRAFT_354692 [Cylindrobasidium torrendii FP15055 ss-10]|uniref:Aminoglycoside phosphotransferase domain-containing protein n=1 Tax=Cylindrobasidium torrendii FP15055 ss-10 TaxID=1314674 RepID=A0A0D7BAT0_9AGAR|nr:hypothetical protein CYLTODRAFT_354692 [Cylindrobasidium torrendii FP15055 ss-10]